MHKSRLAGLIIDCHTDDLDEAARFWGEALGAPPDFEANPAESPYVTLQVADGEPYLEVQSVEHDSRVHIDIEADDIEAEVARLEALGAKRIADIRSFVVLEAPTGQRFCVVPVERAGFDENATQWENQ
jgi:predicted enzyme related to lactoylglutathione lyase